MLLNLANLTGFFLVIVGVLYLISPQALKNTLMFWERGKRIYWAGIVRLVFGAVLVLAAPQCKWMGVVLGIGIFFLVAGLSNFIMSLEKQKAIILWWLGKSAWILRIPSLIVIGIGSLILYSI